MIVHYVKIAFRNMVRQKMYAAIKISGFAIGIAACLLIALYVHNELNYDKQNTNGDRVYRAVGEFVENGKVNRGLSFPPPMAKALINDFPDIEKAGRLMPNRLFAGAGSNQLRRADRTDNTYEQGFCFADQDIMDILQIPIIQGNRDHALTDPNTMVISKRMADKYFPNENPVGKVMYLNDRTDKPFKISAVMQNMPANVHLQYDFFISLTGVSFWNGEQDSWGSSNYTVYLLLKPGTNAAQLQKKILAGVLNKYVIPSMKNSSKADIQALISSTSLYLQPLKDIYLKSYNIEEEYGSKQGDIRFVWLFTAIALFILAIACINFLNLSTARAANRAREVGVRKVIGSLKGNLVKQFLTESVLYSFLSFIIAVIVAWALLPLFNTMAGKTLTFTFMGPWLLPLLLLAALIIGIIAGIYPAFYLSAFKPVNVLKGKLSIGSKNASLRSILVVFQFTTSIILMIGTLIIYRQMHYVLNTNTGFSKDQVLMIQGANTLRNQTAAFKNELLKLPSVKSVTVSDFLPVAGTKRNGNTFWKEGKIKEDAGVDVQHWEVDDDYISTLGMKLIAGRNFSKDIRTDSQATIINKALADKLGLADPLGKIITNGWEHLTIIGVVDNFNFESMKEQVRPLCMLLGNSNDVVSIKVKGADIQKTITAVTNTWKSFLPHQTIRYTFLDESFTAMYADVQRTSLIFTCFSVLAVIVACLGLFALAAFMAEQRKKEISVRKVLGASVTGLFTLLTGNFLKLVGISLLIAVPVGWYLMNRWLQDYAYRIRITWDVFVIAGISVMFIALATICYQALKAAIVSPANALRSE